MANINTRMKYGRYESLREKILSNVTKVGDCWELNAAPGSHGYPCISFGGKRWTGHRASFEVFHGSIPSGLVVMHKCDNKKCCNPSHLKAGTQKQNVHDCMTKKRARKKQKLSFEQILEIRILTKLSNMTHEQIASHYMISRPMVSAIYASTRRGEC